MTAQVLLRLASAEAASHARFGKAERFGPLVAVHAGPGLPVNAAWQGGTRPPTREELAAFEGWSAAHGQRATLHLLSHAAPTLLPLLEARRYTLSSVLHAYTRDLTALPPPPALEIREEPDADAWAALAARGFGPGSEQIMRLVAHTPGTRRFVAELDGEAAGTGAFVLTEGVAALHGTATRPELRGRGVQGALLAGRLRAAAEAGADLASVFVTPGTGSERNVARAGFRLAGARLTLGRQ